MLQTQAGQNARVVYSDVFKTAEKATHRLPGKCVTDTTEPPPLPLGLGCEGLSRLYPWGWALRGAFPTPAAQVYFASYQGLTLEKRHLKKS